MNHKVLMLYPKEIYFSLYPYGPLH